MIHPDRIFLQTCLVIATMLTVAAAHGQSPAREKTVATAFPEVTLFSTEQRMLHSDIIDDDYQILVSLPYGYARTDTTYPVFYTLDANIGFGIADNVVHLLSTLNKEIPELIIVGIAYRIKGVEDWAAMRERDFRPTGHPDKDKAWQDRLSAASGRNDIVVESGGADKFLAFIREELIPFVESNYRVSPDRAIAGVSASGLFTIYALLEHRDTFQRYFVASPSISWDEPFMYQLESDYAATHDDMPVRVFMCVGGLESVTYRENMQRMAGLLLSRRYPNLELEAQVFGNETHGSIFQASISRALKALYKN
jgi:predicted alpha/beta superfamily hydrolase